MMGGGAAVGDVNGDGKNELIFSSNNGTLYIGTVTNHGSTMTFTPSWSRDFGSSLGFHEAIVIADFNNDGINEIAIGDNFGQILIIGKGDFPLITITSPSNNYVSSQGNVLIKWSVTDDHYTLHYTEIYVGGSLSCKVGGSQRNALVSLIPGQNIVEVIGFDFSGRNNSSFIIIKFDVNAPQVFITSPENYYYTALSTVTIYYYNIDNDDDFEYYKIYRNNTEIVNSTNLESYPVNLPSDGIWNITVIAVDEEFLEGSDTIFVIRDTSPPNIVITSPSDGQAVKVSSLEVYWSASDSLTDISHYKIYLDDVYYDTTISKSYILTLGVDKEYKIEVFAYDLLNNVNSDTIVIKKDAINPTISLNPPSLPLRTDGMYYTNNPSLSLSWVASDNPLGSGLFVIEVTINGLLYASYSEATTSALINLSTDGFKNIFVIAKDKAGNLGQDHITVILDRAAPILTIDYPNDNYITGLNYVVVSWSAYDMGVGIKEYTILVDGSIEDVLTDPSASFYFIPLLENKTYLITIQVIDHLEYSFERSINVTYDSSYPLVSITSPAKLDNSINVTSITLNWAISGFTPNYFEIYVNESLYGNYSSAFFSVLIQFGVVPIDEYPLYNITICAFSMNSSVYRDLRWIRIDQLAPNIVFNNPSHNDLIINPSLLVEWYGFDDGSNINSYRIKLATNDIYRDFSSNSYLLNISNLDGTYLLTIYAYDNAGNSASSTISIQISLMAPEFTTSLSPVVYCNNLSFQFIVNIHKPHLGVKSIAITADNIFTIFSIDYGTIYQTTPFELIINASESNFLAGIHHNLSISIKDYLGRENRAIHSIILDQVKPTFWQAPIINSTLLTMQTDTEFFLSDGPNIHRLVVLIYDTSGLKNVNVTILGTNYNQTYQMMFNPENSAESLYQYSLNIDFSELGSGSYSLIFNFQDIAGNSNSVTYTIKLSVITIVDPTSDFPYTYVIIGFALAIILSAFLVLVLRKPVANIGWQKELVVIAYVLNSGLTTLFIPYSSEIITDEQLFGGAMTGIRGILEEIIGKKQKYNIQKVEFGNKHLLIYTGFFGDAVALVKSIKPMHAKLLANFAEEFEEKYSSVLADDTHVSLKDYQDANILVEKYFGKRITFDASKYQFSPLESERYIISMEQKEDFEIKDSFIGSFFQEITSQHEVFDKLSENVKVLIGDTILFAEESLTDLISGDFRKAEIKAKASLNSLTLAKESLESQVAFEKLFNTIPKIIEMVIYGSQSGRKGDIEELHKAIEVASQLFLSQVA